ncbi:Uncharacterised protein [Mycobacteroides abscessus subsp. abscessus]|nr:Uncharacterised protein [Mycobacteroides abscessus subsp. abscessus]
MTVATLRRISGLVSATFMPSTSTVPSVGRSAPTMHRRMVDLPAPLRPVSATASPSLMVRLNLSTMVWSPYRLTRLSTLSTVFALAMDTLFTIDQGAPTPVGASLLGRGPARAVGGLWEDWWHVPDPCHPRQASR